MAFPTNRDKSAVVATVTVEIKRAFRHVHCAHVRFAGEQKTTHFALAVQDRTRAVIGALSQVGYPANGRILLGSEKTDRLTNNGLLRVGREAQGKSTPGEPSPFRRPLSVVFKFLVASSVQDDCREKY